MTDKFLEKLGNLLPEVEVLHPYPDVRFASSNPLYGVERDHPNFGGHTRGKNRVR